MKYHWLSERREERLLIFCNGWGMDEKPFAELATAGLSVLVLSNFTYLSSRDRDVVLSLIKDFERYTERFLLAWSMGVWVAQKLFVGHENLFHKTIAVNGTLCPISEQYGIPRELFRSTARGWSETSRQKFYRRMCGEKQLTEQFLKNEPERSVSDQQEELIWYLEQVDCLPEEERLFNEVWVSDNDRVMPTKSQLSYWGSEVKMLNGGHFPFYQNKSWRELLELLS